MTVQCPRCGTQYRVSDARLSEPRAVFKCARCNHVFSRDERSTSRGGGRNRGDSRTLSLPFGVPEHPKREGPRELGVEGDLEVEMPPASRPSADDAGDGVDREDLLAADDEHELDGADDEDRDEEDEEADVEDEDEAEDQEGDDATRVSTASRRPSRADKPTPEPAFVADLPREKDRTEKRTERGETGSRAAARGAARSRPAAGKGKTFDDLEDDETETQAEDSIVISRRDRPERGPISTRGRASSRGGRSPLKPVALGAALVVGAFVVCSAVLSRRPEIAFDLLGSVPVLGRLLGDDHLLLWRIQIAGVESGLDHIKGDRAALVVSGQVVNTSDQTLRLIEVEGMLLADGVEKRRQVVYAANQFRKTIRDLSASEVEMLLRLEPNRRFAVRPGESASFLIVFPDPPSNATEVTCRVVDARAT